MKVKDNVLFFASGIQGQLTWAGIFKGMNNNRFYSKPPLREISPRAVDMVRL